MAKPRILFKVEAHWLATGYANYGHEMLKRWHDSGKYDVAEMAVYGCEADLAQRTTPWQVFPVAPNPNERELLEFHKRNPHAAFGRLKWEETCLKFKPDIVVSIDDKWMSDFIAFSPFRPFYKFIHMPTVDAAPQADDWMNMYIGCDGLFAYNDWSLKQLKEQGGPLVNVYEEAPPAADTDIFKPVGDKAEHKARCGLPPDSFIIGTVMRNQKRKLFPDLLRAFAEFLQTTSPDIAAKSWLYLHTCYPDNEGWNIPKLLKEFGLTNKVLFTYHCRTGCNAAYPQTYHDAIANCSQCGNRTAGLVNSMAGISTAALATIINCFDVFVQLAICEGFGIPQLEAAACGVPVLSTDYSAMEDVVRKVKGVPIKVGAWTRELSTGRYFAGPDIAHLIEQFNKFANMPDSLRKKKSFDCVSAVKSNYSWDKTAKKWMAVFDSLNLPDHSQTWNSPPRFHTPPKVFDPQTGQDVINVPPNLSLEEIIHWGIVNVLGLPQYLNSSLYSRLVRDVQNGLCMIPPELHGGYIEGMIDMRPDMFTMDNALGILYNKRKQINDWELERTKHVV